VSASLKDGSKEVETLAVPDACDVVAVHSSWYDGSTAAQVDATSESAGLDLVCAVFRVFAGFFWTTGNS
jgi:hypothetical protein